MASRPASLVAATGADSRQLRPRMRPCRHKRLQREAMFPFDAFDEEPGGALVRLEWRPGEFGDRDEASHASLLSCAGSKRWLAGRWDSTRASSAAASGTISTSDRALDSTRRATVPRTKSASVELLRL